MVHVPISREELKTVLLVSELLDEDPVLISYHDPATSDLAEPWACFDVAGRKFGIWRATGVLYEGDENGAMSDEPLDPTTIVKE